MLVCCVGIPDSAPIRSGYALRHVLRPDFSDIADEGDGTVWTVDAAETTSQ